MKQRVYIDTSVIGGCFDKDFDAVKMMREKKAISISTMAFPTLQTAFTKLYL